jgi:flagellar biosynthesis/type III secretory pathway chaperone
MARPDLMRELAAIIEREAAAADDLLEALLCEKRALAASDSAALADATARKSTTLAVLESSEGERRSLVQFGMPSAASADMQGLLDRLAADSMDTPAMISIVRNWTRLRATLQQCRDTNIVNGQIVAAMHRRVQQALNLLRGGRGTIATYGRTGSTQLAGAGSRELARA